jgi:NAD(P)H-dependent flavin oxidoreductase YrpB (nitropropane dioxygenase family)
VQLPSLFHELAVPVIGAPLGGGPSTPALVDAVGRAGGLGFLAAGYKTPDAVADQIRAVRASGRPFGVNVFAPNPLHVDPREFRAYAARIAADAARYDIDTTAAEPVEDEDYWGAKLELLRTDPVPVVSFTFGLPDPASVTALQRAGTLVLLTVTAPDEARLAADLHPDALVVQCAAAGGHSGTLTPRTPAPELPLPELVQAVRAEVTVPVIAAGGIGIAEQARAALHVGAGAVAIGTLLMRTDESGASATHQATLADPGRVDTVVTRAFTGRPARALRNAFTDRYSEVAPFGYPAVHHLTSAMRKAAAAANDPERLHLWAGSGFRQARTGPAADVVTELAAGM